MHGWGANREVWRPLLASLRPWANVTLVDVGGCSPGSVVQDRPALDETLAEIVQCCPPGAVYIGWSLGGQLALEMARRYPERVRAVITLCSNPRFVTGAGWPGMADSQFQAFCAAAESDPVLALQRFDALQTRGSPRSRELLRKLKSLQRKPADSTLMAGLEWLTALDQRDDMVGLSIPQFHLLAPQDELVPAEVAQSLTELLSAVPGATVKVLATGCHLALLEMPAELAGEIESFLARADLLDAGRVCAPRVEKSDIAESFSRAAAVYDSVAHLQRDVGEQLFTRLERYRGEAGVILDLGCGTGYFAPRLQQRYGDSTYIGLDLATGMVAYARDHCADSCNWVAADAESMPLASNSIDLIFSSLAIQWCYRPRHLLAELARVLRPGGCCLFSTLGPETLGELRTAWAAVDSHQHVNTFLPVSELLAAADEISGVRLELEQQTFRMEYQRVGDLLAELKTLGAHNMNRSRPVGLTSRRTLQGMLQAYENFREEGFLPATYDVVFGTLEKV